MARIFCLTVFAAEEILGIETLGTLVPNQTMFLLTLNSP